MTGKKKRPEREPVAAAIVLASIRLADEAMLAAINECATVAGRPWDPWRQDMIGVRAEIRRVYERIEAWA